MIGANGGDGDSPGDRATGIWVHEASPSAILVGVYVGGGGGSGVGAGGGGGGGYIGGAGGGKLGTAAGWGGSWNTSNGLTLLGGDGENAPTPNFEEIYGVSYDGSDSFTDDNGVIRYVGPYYRGGVGAYVSYGQPGYAGGGGGGLGGGGGGFVAPPCYPSVCGDVTGLPTTMSLYRAGDFGGDGGGFGTECSWTEGAPPNDEATKWIDGTQFYCEWLYPPEQRFGGGLGVNSYTVVNETVPAEAGLLMNDSYRWGGNAGIVILSWDEYGGCTLFP